MLYFLAETVDNMKLIWGSTWEIWETQFLFLVGASAGLCQNTYERLMDTTHCISDSSHTPDSV